MGVSQFSNHVQDKILDKFLHSDREDLMTGLRKYVNPAGKTIDEVLEELETVEESMEDGVGVAYRHMRYTGGKARLSEKNEERLAEAAYVRHLIKLVQQLKQWAANDFSQ